MAIRWQACALHAAWFLSISFAAACSGNSANSGNANGGSGVTAGSGGSAVGVSGASAASVAAGFGGTGGVSSGGASIGGAPSSSAGASSGGTGGASSGGANAGGSSGATGSAGGAGGSKNCAGNAVSLSANSTGTASDAARARVEIDLMSDLPIGNAPRTVEFWAYVKPTDWVGEKNELYVYGSPGTTNTAFGLDFGTNAVTGMPDNHATLNPYTNGSFTVDSQADLGITSSASQWVHIAMTWDGTTLNTYVNGESKITKTNGTAMLATTSSVLTMGCNPPINNCFNGFFDELRVWNVARAAADIKGNFSKSLTGNEPGLVGYWKFDEAPGATAAVDSANASGHPPHTGQLLAASSAGTPAFITPDPPAPVACP